MKAACADAATGDLELEDGVASHLGFLRLKGARRPTRAPENAEKGRKTGGRGVEERRRSRSVEDRKRMAKADTGEESRLG
ncbi:hypothetical protein NDU88_000263 [Pleurodeles waltl]|uniref:Uncharacterized protein n=1 Tax=Pleurodeles waltl TaxID=8319 RepID=A0AAV7V6I6_PLEWA|nr:hypothetical protein NDU88_000263 [Pleurodeles waltl]